jgi:hypothetical protein
MAQGARSRGAVRMVMVSESYPQAKKPRSQKAQDRAQAQEARPGFAVDLEHSEVSECL